MYRERQKKRVKSKREKEEAKKKNIPKIFTCLLKKLGLRQADGQVTGFSRQQET
jgi:hypothetical protein